MFLVEESVKRLFVKMSLFSFIILFSLKISLAQSFVSAPAYHLIIASYKSFEAANNFVEVLQQKGIQAYIVFPEADGNVYRVSIYGSPDRAMVASYKSQMRNKYEGWIYFQDIPQQPASQKLRMNPNTGSVTRPPTNNPQQRLISGLENSQGVMYYLILGSYDSYETAQKRANSLRTNKYEPDILLPTANTPKYRVYVYATGDKAEIEAYAQRLETTHRQSGWIYAQPVELMPFENGLPEPSFASRGQNNRPLPQENTSMQPSPVSFNFYLIAASFRKLKQAQQFAQELVREGFSPLILTDDGSNGHYRVSIYHAYSREEVQYYADQLRKSQGKKYWIFQP